MAPTDDGWVEGFDPEGDYFRRLKEEGIPPPHHEKWDEALQKALDEVTADWEERREGEFTITLRVRVSKRNPGWVDGYQAVPSS